MKKILFIGLLCFTHIVALAQKENSCAFPITLLEADDSSVFLQNAFGFVADTIPTQIEDSELYKVQKFSLVTFLQLDSNEIATDNPLVPGEFFMCYIYPHNSDEFYKTFVFSPDVYIVDEKGKKLFPLIAIPEKYTGNRWLLYEGMLLTMKDQAIIKNY